MPITYTIDYEQQLIMEVWTGEIQASDLAEYWKRLLDDAEAMEIRRTVADLRQAVILFTGLDVNYLLQLIVHPRLTGRGWKTAILVGDPSHLGISRQYQVFAKVYSKDAIFHSMEEAQSWLCHDDQESA